MNLLTYAIMVPEESCAELRDSFGFTFLPLVETPAELDLPYEETFVTSPSGVPLRVWYIPAQAPQGVILMSTGSAGAMPCHLYLPMLLHAERWSIVMYEYQGFGQSGGEPSVMSLPGDLETVLDWTLERTGAPQVTLYGLSLGSIPSVTMAVERPADVNAVVLDSPVALAEEIGRFDPVLHGRSPWVISLLNPRLISEDLIRQMQQPLLVFLHEDDYVTPPTLVELLYDRAPGAKRLVRFAELGHASGLYFQTSEYMHPLLEFLGGVVTPIE